MNPNLNSLRIALLQCLSSPDVTADQITDVVRETVRTKMDEATATTNKSRTVLDKLRVPHQYTSNPDWMVTDHLKGDDYISFSDGYHIQAAQPVMNFDGIYGAAGQDTISL